MPWKISPADAGKRTTLRRHGQMGSPGETRSSSIIVIASMLVWGDSRVGHGGGRLRWKHPGGSHKRGYRSMNL
jgi:hypothetical protein